MNFKRNNTGRRRASPIALVIVAVALAAMILPAAGVLALDVLTRATRQLNSAVNGGAAAATFVPELSLVQLDRWQGTERVNILLIGIDQRPDEDPDQARTDTMMLLTLDPQAKTAGMMSIPRDLYVPLPSGGQDRINTAHVYGGPELAMQTVEYNFGLPVHHYVRVNFNALVKLVDLAGGVDIYVDQDIDDPSFPDDHYGFEPFAISAGWQHMDGKTALKYARTRHDSSDFYRMRRQQQVIMALRDTVQSTDAFTKVLPNAPQILMTLNDSIQTDLSAVQIVQLAALARDIPPEKISRVAMDETAVQGWTTPQGGSVLVPVRARLEELRQKLYNPPPPPPTAEAQATPEPALVSVQNGTQVKGLAATTKAYLEGKGFTVVEVGNATQSYPKSIIVDYRGRQGFVAQLAAALGLPLSAVNSLEDANSPVDALVILGEDYRPPADNQATK